MLPLEQHHLHGAADAEDLAHRLRRVAGRGNVDALQVLREVEGLRAVLLRQVRGRQQARVRQHKALLGARVLVARLPRTAPFESGAISFSQDMTGQTLH
jgi:hypothetical protein